jgi:hypothetical protein
MEETSLENRSASINNVLETDEHETVKRALVDTINNSE